MDDHPLHVNELDEQELGCVHPPLAHRRHQHAAGARRRAALDSDCSNDSKRSEIQDAMDGSASVPLTPSMLRDGEFGGVDDVSERSVLVAPLDGDGKPRKHATWEWMLGVFFLVVVALIWTFASVLVQYIFHNLSFNGPFFLTYVGITLFSVNLPLWYLSQIAWPRAKAWFQGRPTTGKLSHHELLKRTGHKASYRQIFWISATISPLWFLANFTYNQSLNMTSVTSSTIVSSTSTVFTFLMSVLVLREPFMWLKVLGVVLCMAGNISTIFNDSSAEGDAASDHVFGDLVALFAAFMYGVYTTAIRHLVPNEESVSISLFFGFIGVINFVCLLPFVLLFHYSGIESLSGLTFEILGLIGIKGLFDNVLSDYLWARAVLLTSPTVATVGLSLTVPLAILADYVFHQSAPTSVTLLASALVLSGFVLINVSTKNNKHEYHPVATTKRLDNDIDNDMGVSTGSSTSGASPPLPQYRVDV